MVQPSPRAPRVSSTAAYKADVLVARPTKPERGTHLRLKGTHEAAGHSATYDLTSQATVTPPLTRHSRDFPESKDPESPDNGESRAPGHSVKAKRGQELRSHRHLDPALHCSS